MGNLSIFTAGVISVLLRDHAAAEVPLPAAEERASTAPAEKIFTSEITNLDLLKATESAYGTQRIPRVPVQARLLEEIAPERRFLEDTAPDTAPEDELSSTLAPTSTRWNKPDIANLLPDSYLCRTRSKEVIRYFAEKTDEERQQECHECPRSIGDASKCSYHDLCKLGPRKACTLVTDDKYFCRGRQEDCLQQIEGYNNYCGTFATR